MEKNRRPREEIVKELVERENPANPDIGVLSYEGWLARTVKEIFPEVRTLHITLEDAPGICRKTLLYYRAKYYDIETYARDFLRKEREAIARGEIGRDLASMKEGQCAKVRAWIRADAERIVEDLKAGRVPEWTDAWILDERSPLIA
jgi:hypothetical protein